MHGMKHHRRRIPGFISGAFSLPLGIAEGRDRCAVFARIFARSDETTELDDSRAFDFDTGATSIDDEGFPTREGTVASCPSFRRFASARCFSSRHSSFASALLSSLSAVSLSVSGRPYVLLSLSSDSCLAFSTFFSSRNRLRTVRESA